MKNAKILYVNVCFSERMNRAFLHLVYSQIRASCSLLEWLIVGVQRWRFGVAAESFGL